MLAVSEDDDSGRGQVLRYSVLVSPEASTVHVGTEPGWKMVAGAEARCRRGDRWQNGGTSERVNEAHESKAKKAR